MKAAAVVLTLLVLVVGAVAMGSSNKSFDSSKDYNYMVYKHTAVMPSKSMYSYDYKASSPKTYYKKDYQRDYYHGDKRYDLKRYAVKKLKRGLFCLYFLALALGVLLYVWLKVIKLKRKLYPKGFKKRRR